MASERAEHHDGIERRELLKAAGAGAVGVAALSGSASAHAPTEIRFCGCSQVCVERSEDHSAFRVVYATDVDGDFECTTPGEEDKIRTDTCVEADSGRKIVGIIGGDGRFYCNPNNCARMALGRSTDPDCPDPETGCVDCTQVDRHEYVCNGVTVRTRQCKPPSEWNGGNGPSNGGGPP